MGDIPEDVKMVKDDEHDYVLRIGFLNDMKKSSHLIE